MNTTKKHSVVDKISFVLIVAAIGILVVTSGIAHNPDQDVYFLIDNGRYIVNNHCLPETAYWLIKQDVPTIIQQWMCCVVNYFAYFVGGYTGIRILGIVFNLILLFSLFLFCREVLKNNQVGFNAAVFCWILLAAFQSTRPYSITISLTLLENILLVLETFLERTGHWNHVEVFWIICLTKLTTEIFKATFTILQSTRITNLITNVTIGTSCLTYKLVVSYIE